MNDNRFFYNDNSNHENDGLQGAPSYVNNGNAPQEGIAPRQENEILSQNSSSYPRRMGSEQFYQDGPGPGGKKPKKEKTPFLTKKAAAVVLALCVGASAVFGFSAGVMSGQGSSTGSAGSDTGVIQTSAEATSTGSDLSVSDIVNKTQNSIVEITTEVVQTNQFMQEVSGEAAGSGIIISADGYIATNNHVVEDGTSFTVRLKNGESYDATLIGRDPTMDLAVLKIEAEGLTPVTFGDSSALEVGDTAVAIGNPLGTLGGTVTNGIISALNREIDLGDGTMSLIQTNAAINPGNSGGGLFNGQGELIGVVVAKSGGTNIEGLGFAIPGNEAKTILDELIENGYVQGRASLGMSVIDVNSQQAAMSYRLSSTGVYVLQVEDGSEAANLGIKAGDRIVSLDGTEITGATDLNNVLKSHSPGDTVEITIERSGRTASTNVTLTESVPTNS